MNIKEAAKKSGLTLQALYKQIREKRGYGRYFVRDVAGKWSIDSKLVRKK